MSDFTVYHTLGAYINTYIHTIYIFIYHMHMSHSPLHLYLWVCLHIYEHIHNFWLEYKQVPFQGNRKCICVCVCVCVYSRNQINMYINKNKSRPDVLLRNLYQQVTSLLVRFKSSTVWWYFIFSCIINYLQLTLYIQCPILDTKYWKKNVSNLKSSWSKSADTYLELA